jgi:hypothetical protein
MITLNWAHKDFFPEVLKAQVLMLVYDNVRHRLVKVKRLNIIMNRINGIIHWLEWLLLLQ